MTFVSRNNFSYGMFFRRYSTRGGFTVSLLAARTLTNPESTWNFWKVEAVVW